MNLPHVIGDMALYCDLDWRCFFVGDIKLQHGSVERLRYERSSKHTPELFGQSLKTAVVSELASVVDMFAVDVQAENTKNKSGGGGASLAVFICLLKHDGHQTTLRPRNRRCREWMEKLAE
jgi:hypothetical protein